MTEKLLKKIDVGLLILLPVLAVWISLWIEANFLESILLFFGVPALWFSIRTPQKILKTGIFALVLVTPLFLVLDYMAILDGAWLVPETVFGGRLFGVVPWEDFIWGGILIYYIVIFYEHFLDKGKHGLMDKRMKYLIWPIIIAVSLFTLSYLFDPEILRVKYFYIIWGVILLFIPAVTFLSFFPRLLSKYVKVGVYFFGLALMFELVGLELGHWTFPGENFIGWVELGGYRFPFEEFFFWFVMSAIAILSYFEFFDDDRK